MSKKIVIDAIRNAFDMEVVNEIVLKNDKIIILFPNGEKAKISVEDL